MQIRIGIHLLFYETSFAYLKNPTPISDVFGLHDRIGTKSERGTKSVRGQWGWGKHVKCMKNDVRNYLKFESRF